MFQNLAVKSVKAHNRRSLIPCWLPRSLPPIPAQRLDSFNTFPPSILLRVSRLVDHEPSFVCKHSLAPLSLSLSLSLSASSTLIYFTLSPYLAQLPFRSPPPRERELSSSFKLIAFAFPVAAFSDNFFRQSSLPVSLGVKHGAFQEASRHSSFTALADSPSFDVRRQLPCHC